MVVKNDERKRFLDSVGPEFAHVMVIAVVKKMNCWLLCNVVCGSVAALGTVAIFDNAVTFGIAAAFCFINHFIDCLYGIVVAVAVCSDDFRTVEPMDVR